MSGGGRHRPAPNRVQTERGIAKMGVVWTYEGFITKAETYFRRAREHPTADDPETGIWLLLGLEFLLRAPLAKVHPLLLADNGNAMLAHAGLPQAQTLAGANKSIPVTLVIEHLRHVVDGFGTEQITDAKRLVEWRNEELHGDTSPLEADASEWLPAFTRIAAVICEHLGLDSSELIGAQIMYAGERLATLADKKVKHQVRQEIEAAKAFMARLTEEEVAARHERLAKVNVQAMANMWVQDRERYDGMSGFAVVDCPACGSTSLVRYDSARTAGERFDASSESVVHDVVFLAGVFVCLVCGLRLEGVAQCVAAGIPAQEIKEIPADSVKRFNIMIT